MDLLFQIIAGFAVCCCLYLFKSLLDVRVDLRHYANSVESMKTLLPAPKLMELQALFTQLKSEFDNQLVENDSFREKTYRQIQRFDTIMRRNERAASALESDRGDDDEPLPQVGQKPEALPMSEVLARPTSSSRGERQRRLRADWIKNRGA